MRVGIARLVGVVEILGGAGIVAGAVSGTRAPLAVLKQRLRGLRIAIVKGFGGLLVTALPEVEPFECDAF